MSCNCNCSKGKKQSGGSSDFIGSFYSATAVGGVQRLSELTARVINQAPMFNPLSTENVVIPTLPSTGIIETPAYLAALNNSQQ